MVTQKKMPQGDIHTIPDSRFVDLMNKDENKEKRVFYYISTRDILRRLHDSFGVPLSAQKKVIPDDIVRLFGILLTDEDLRDYVQDVTKDTKSVERTKIDASKGRILSCYHNLCAKFIDQEVVVKFPDEWTHPSTREKVDTHVKKVGTFDKFGQFNPNNIDRCRLGWSWEDMKVSLTVFVRTIPPLKPTYLSSPLLHGKEHFQECYDGL